MDLVNSERIQLRDGAAGGVREEALNGMFGRDHPAACGKAEGEEGGWALQLPRQ